MMIWFYVAGGSMAYTGDGSKIAVVISPGGSAIDYRAQRAGREVRELLIENGIGHTVGRFPSEFGEDRQIIYVGKLWEDSGFRTCWIRFSSAITRLFTSK